MAVIDRHAAALWSNPDQGWNDWLKRRFLSTLGTAFLEACHRLIPDVATGDLVLDIDTMSSPQDEAHEFWITETTLGGAGVVEQLVNRYADDRVRFFRLVEAALNPSDFELVDRELVRILDLLNRDSDLRADVQRLRSASNPTTAHSALRVLLSSLGGPRCPGEPLRHRRVLRTCPQAR